MRDFSDHWKGVMHLALELSINSICSAIEDLSEGSQNCMGWA